MKSYKDLVDKVASLGADAGKAAQGNKSAGVRVRAGMLEVKKLTTDVRNEVPVCCTRQPTGIVKGGE